MMEQNAITDIIRIFYKWRKFILIVTVAAALVSTAVALLLPNYYKSTEIFYPYSLEALDPKNMLADEIADVFGTSGDIDRLKQIGMSGQLIGYMVWKFDLYKRYDIDPKEKYAGYEVVEEFKENYSIIKNDMGALEVTVMDQDPNLAARMASEVVGYIDSINKQSLIENNTKLYNSLNASLEEKYRELNDVEQGIKLEGDVSQKLSAKTILQSKSSSELDAKLMERLLQTIDLKEKYAQIRSFLTGNFDTIFIIEKASPAIKKSRPVRWLIVAGSTLLAFFISIFALLILEFYRNNIREILKDAK